MGHFGRWSSCKSQTADHMVAIHNVNYEKDACVNIMSLYNSFQVWFRDHNNIYHPYANDPLMINLEWTYDSDSKNYTFEFGHFW